MKNKLLRLLGDRLVWFVAFGLVLFAFDWLAARRDAQIIRIDLPLVEKLVAQWEGQTKRRPNARELDALIEGYIREEILVREAQRLGLDNDDVIVRRRLAQKVEFLLADNNPPPMPDEAGLREWFDENRAAYNTPEKLSWRHIFAASREEAETLLRRVRDTPAAWQGLGQPFMLSRTYMRQTRAELMQLMGGDFADAVFAGQTGNWFGPVRSAYGWHVIEIEARHAPVVARFEPIAERVAKDWGNAMAEEDRARAWQELRASYDIRLMPETP